MTQPTIDYGGDDDGISLGSDDSVTYVSDSGESWGTATQSVSPPSAPQSSGPKRQKQGSSGGYKSWCYTKNNYTEAHILQFKAIECTYHVMGFEKGSTPHIQGCITFKKSTGFKRVKELLCGAHIEKANDLEKSRNYCMKVYNHGWYSGYDQFHPTLGSKEGGWGWPDFLN